ncbi:MAG TPA: hypothetical protein VHT05_01685 [Candidatus Elarobacter sp.]|nr:hypothetical protein [Candidatus Elarobacter sp.]
MSTTESTAATIFGLGVRAELHDAGDLGALGGEAEVRYAMRRGRANLWIVASLDGADALALRVGHGVDELAGDVTRAETPDGIVFEFATAHAAFRAKVAFPAEDRRLIRVTTSVLPTRALAVPFWPRDLSVLLTERGTVHTAQRGARSGIVFAGSSEQAPCTLFYLQNFSALTEYFEATNRGPAGSVGGRWPELGYAPPAGEDCVLPASRELVVSDVYLTLSSERLDGEGEIAARYLDLLAQTYLCLPRPPAAYHDWPSRAERTVRDLNLSPRCTALRDGARYALPYVGDEAKPPESMVQFTLAVNAHEYASWRKEPDALAAALARTVPAFFDAEVGCVVRWLPGTPFDAEQGEANMNHEDMDSWYLYHALFNVARLAAIGDEPARDVLARSLPYAMRVARRFAYRWPVFFKLRTLDIVRAEAAPKHGGERDVGGLYALVMLHAHELFGDAEYLDEAARALAALRGLGFALGYQMNTTGFGAEAAMRMWKKTKDRTYLELSEICMANLFDNMWLWECRYGRARDYRTFFGLFPLRDAPYLAAYEELEAQAKFRDYLELGGEDVRPALRLLLAEYQRYSLDRGWHFYPDTLPAETIAEKTRNGRVERALSIPIEDLRDGHEQSGQVGQEIYGAGMAFVYTTRHYHRIAGTGCLAFSDYPIYDLRVDASRRRARWRVGGDPRCACKVRIVPEHAHLSPFAVTLTQRAGSVDVPVAGAQTTEGHAEFEVRGGRTVELAWGADGMVIGDVRRGTAAP